MAWILNIFTISLIMFGGDRVCAQTNKETKTTIDFEDQLVEGEVKKPELFYLLQKKEFNYNRLIKLRTDFIPEMIKSAEDISLAIDDGSELLD